jgi:hypothetical protein
MRNGMAFELQMPERLTTGLESSFLLRTPTAAEVDGGPVSPEVAKAKGQTLRLTGQVLAMLPTVTVSDTFTDQMKSSQQKAGSMHSVNLSQAVHMDWGKFEPAVIRWEKEIKRKAPAPTLPDGQKGQHRLSSLFTEWMMGLEAGWITGRGLHRKDEIKMAGNGVVPQQAKLALEILVNRYDYSNGGD